MRNLSKLVFQRVVAVSVGILLQIGFLIVMATYLRADFFWIRIAMNVLSWAMVIYIISCGVNPSYKIAWIVLILAFPVAGLTIYLLFGGNKISSYEHRKMQSIEAVTMQQLQQEEEPLWELAAARTPAFNHARYLLSASGYPIYDDADATYFPSGESCYAAMLEELQKAEHYIFIEFFIIAQGKMWDPILQILREKAAAGVDVRVVYDDFGCITRLPMQYAKKLREMGIRAHAFNPYVPILTDFINMMGTNPLIGPNDEGFGPRFPDMTEPYSLELRSIAKQTADELGISYKEGVYLGFMGPCYETAAEIRAFGGMGADAVGMSTVPETMVCNYLGMKVLAVSCITNMATGIQTVKHSHARVLEIASQAGETLCRWLGAVIQKMEG